MTATTEAFRNVIPGEFTTKSSTLLLALTDHLLGAQLLVQNALLLYLSL